MAGVRYQRATRSHKPSPQSSPSALATRFSLLSSYFVPYHPTRMYIQCQDGRGAATVTCSHTTSAPAPSPSPTRNAILYHSLFPDERDVVLSILSDICPHAELLNAANLMDHALSDLLLVSASSSSASSSATPPPRPQHPWPSSHRALLVCGDAAPFAAQISHELANAGVRPFVVGTPPLGTCSASPSTSSLSKEDSVWTVRDAWHHLFFAFVKAHELHQPWTTTTKSSPSSSSPLATISSSLSPTTSPTATSTPPPTPTVTLNLVLDGGEVPTADGLGTRRDASHLVVLDNMYTEDERVEIMQWLTAGVADPDGHPDPDGADLHPTRWAHSTRDFKLDRTDHNHEHLGETGQQILP